MKSLIALAALVSLAGCASLDHAGVASYTIKPMMIDGRAVCCEVAVHNGKQYASLDAMVEKTGDDYSVRLSERGVEAFRGQQIAADAATASAATAAKAAASIMVAPVALPAAAAAIGVLAK